MTASNPRTRNALDPAWLPGSAEVFAWANSTDLKWMSWGGTLLHGIYYDFFFATGQIYVDRKAPPELRAATQGLITFLTYGVGVFLGSWLSGLVVALTFYPRWTASSATTGT